MEPLDSQQRINQALKVLHAGGIIAYPTESVYGLGCDPSNEIAITKLLALKNRSPHKGLILIGANIHQFENYIETISVHLMQNILSTWPGPVTWVVPAKKTVSPWIRGEHNTIAIRVPDHDLARELCDKFGKPIISTSANREGETPARDEVELRHIFSKDIDFIISGRVGGRKNPSEIRDARTGQIIRQG